MTEKVLTGKRPARRVHFKSRRWGVALCEGRQWLYIKDPVYSRTKSGVTCKKCRRKMA